MDVINTRWMRVAMGADVMNTARRWSRWPLHEGTADTKGILHMYAWAFVYVCARAYVCMRMHAYACVCMRMCACVRACVRARLRLRLRFDRVWSYVRVNFCARKCMHTYMHRSAQLSALVHKCMHKYTTYGRAQARLRCVCMSARGSTRALKCTSVCVCEAMRAQARRSRRRGNKPYTMPSPLNRSAIPNHSELQSIAHALVCVLSVCLRLCVSVSLLRV